MLKFNVDYEAAVTICYKSFKIWNLLFAGSQRSFYKGVDMSAQIPAFTLKAKTKKILS